MNPEQWQQIEDIFQEALDLPAAERARFIEEKCAGDEDLRRAVEKLVVRYEREETFLESPVWTDSRFLGSKAKREIARSLDDEIKPQRKQKAAIGERVGVYRLVEELGRGGMGVVYYATRADGEFRQKVAVKLIKRGMDTDFIVGRFRAERQILANLNHPNIARLLDGGTTDDGSPYFIMEFVEGEPFLKYCREKNLDLRRKLELFLQICRAVAYAHRKKIVHRDIKPSNVLVTEDGEPKLLDFGIAKLLEADSIHEPMMPTATAMRLMTPEYASPEQARGERVTPASDQYSLGILLYELITGARPYKFSSRAPHEIARVICEEIPSEPFSGEFGEVIAETGDVRFDADFCKKLDRAVLKSLRKNPLERYASVEEFARDIEAFLRSETVRAESFASADEAAKASKSGVFSSTPAAPAAQKSIAVLPLKNRSDSPAGETTDGTEFLGVGLADALIARLSNVRSFVVRPTSSVLRFGASDTDSFAAGRELKVNFILDGSILKTEKRLRVSVQLLDVAARSIVWAERFDEDLTDVLTLEDSISARVADSLVPQLSTDEAQNLTRRPTENSKAYEAYLRGRFHWNTFSEDGFRQAISYYRRAIEIDPDFALAFAGIADYHIWLGVYGVLPTAEFYPPARDAALRAVALDPQLSEAYAALGLARLYGEYDWAASEKELRRAVELNPNNSVAHLWFSHVLYSQQRFAEGTKHLKIALELDPLSFQHHNTLAWSYYFSRRFDEALTAAERLVKQFPANEQAHFSRVCFLNYAGKTDEAMAEMRRAAVLSADPLFAAYGFAQTHAAAGNRAALDELIEKTRFESKKELSDFHLALCRSYLKDKEIAFQHLERAFVARESLLVWVAIEPSFDPLRDDARYFALLEKMNHPLARSGRAKISEPDFVKNKAAAAAEVTEPAVSVSSGAIAPRADDEKRLAPEQNAARSPQSLRNIVSPRRAGIKQGLFLVIVSFLSLPISLALIAATGIPPVLQFAIFVCLFFGGLIRLLYAAFFESSAPPDDAQRD
jgi:serine/threonine protein kinase/Tfp pilus assembly protein PilF